MMLEEAKQKYDELVAEARANEPVLRVLKDRPKGYCIHHIVPTSCGGLNIPENKVMCKYEVHFEFHRLLKDVFPRGSKEWKSMWDAWWFMTTTKDGRKIVTPEEFAEVMIVKAELTRELHTGRKRSKETCENSSKAQRKRFQQNPISDETRQNMSNGQRLRAPPSEETRKKRGKSCKLFYEEHPEAREIQSQKMLGTNVGKNNGMAYTVSRYTKQNVFVDRFDTAREASNITGVYYANILRCCHGERKTAGGFIWKHE